MGGVLSLFSGAWGYVAAAAMSAGLAGWLGYDLTHKADLGVINQMKSDDAQAALGAAKTSAAIQKAQDDIALKAAVDEASAQQKIVTQIQTVTKEITVHVPDTAVCIPAGFVRVLNAAASGSDSDTPGTAAGQSDDACAAASWRSLAADLTDDYGAARQNSEQLNALEDSVRDMVAAANK